jgi:hypothetical protein
MMYDVTAIQLLVFCRLASQSGRFDKFNRQKCNLTPRLQQEDRAAPFYPSKVQNKASRCPLKVSSKSARVSR